MTVGKARKTRFVAYLGVYKTEEEELNDALHHALVPHADGDNSVNHWV